jgi:hypothetical protein
MYGNDRSATPRTNEITIYLKVTIFADNSFVDWSKNAKQFVPANISYMYMHYRSLEYVNPVPFLPQIAKFSTRETHFKPKSQKNVPVNNRHLKVYNMQIHG